MMLGARHPHGPRPRTERIGRRPLVQLAGIFDHDPPTSTLPALWHWLYHLDTTPQSDLGRDGHARRTGEPASRRDLLKRMFAGGSIQRLAPIRVGDEVERTSNVLTLREKSGRHGPLAFVDVQHDLRRGGTTVLRETQTLVYHDAPSPVRSASEPPQGDVVARFRPSEVHLFRLSALTYNSHRIHYDRSYATEVEGYRDLVVQGPLIALFLAEHIRQHVPRVVVTAFRFRAHSPAYVNEQIDCRADWADQTIQLQAHVGSTLVMTAQATLAEVRRGGIRTT